MMKPDTQPNGKALLEAVEANIENARQNAAQPQPAISHAQRMGSVQPAAERGVV